jgi:hypothetical protein
LLGRSCSACFRDRNHMHLTEVSNDLLSTCQSELVRLLDDFEAAPSGQGLSEVGAIAEVLTLSEPMHDPAPLTQMMRDAAARWLRSGALEELCFSRVELTNQVAILAFMAQRSADFSRTDMGIMKRLCDGGLVGRSEMPVLNQQLIAAYFSRCGAGNVFGHAGDRDLARLVDKRVLRARSDEYDLEVLLMCAQLLQLGLKDIRNKPCVYPRTLLVHAIRTQNANWVPVLTFLCAHWFRLEENLRNAALKSMLQHMPSRGELLPAPPSTKVDGEDIGRAGRGLRIRSTVALLTSLCTLGVTYVEDRACASVC